jgi:hypothetical protein
MKILITIYYILQGDLVLSVVKDKGVLITCIYLLLLYT